MTDAVQGQPVPLVAEFFQYAGGPAIDVTNLRYTIVRLSDSFAVLGPTAVSIVHVATGVYSFTWAVPVNQAVGQYAVVWTATEAQASEVFAVLPSTSGQGPSAGPCAGWDAPIWTCALSPVAAAVSGTAVAAAADVLYALTGRHLGSCQLTVRPCRQDCGGTWPFAGAYWWEMGVYPRPVFYQGVWTNLTCSSCQNGCSCGVVQEALLPAPVSQVLQVKVDGVVLDPTAYRVDDWRRLVRLDGGSWPLCNDLSKADTAAGTWSVTLTVGEPVSTLGQLALGELATQFAKLIACESDCVIPRPVQQLVRQGVTMNFLDPNTVFTEGRLGLYLCDLFISTVNPHGLASRSQVYDVDAAGYRITNT